MSRYLLRHALYSLGWLQSPSALIDVIPVEAGVGDVLIVCEPQPCAEVHGMMAQRCGHDVLKLKAILTILRRSTVVASTDERALHRHRGAVEMAACSSREAMN